MSCGGGDELYTEGGVVSECGGIHSVASMTDYFSLSSHLDIVDGRKQRRSCAQAFTISGRLEDVSRSARSRRYHVGRHRLPSLAPASFSSSSLPSSCCRLSPSCRLSLSIGSGIALVRRKTYGTAVGRHERVRCRFKNRVARCEVRLPLV